MDIPNSPDANLSTTNLTKKVKNKNVVKKCGCLCFYPSSLQRLADNKILLAALCSFAFVQGFVINGINNVNTASYERRFRITAAQAGSITSAYDFSASIAILPASYIGTFVHKPRMVGLAFLTLGCGSFIMLLPQLITEPYEAGLVDSTYCSTDNPDIRCGKNQGEPASDMLYVLILGQVVHGIAGCILFTVGIATLDDNVERQTSPLFLGIFYSFTAVGPAIGYVAGGKFLSLYVDFNRDIKVPFEENDPRWVGAWWIGLCLSAALSGTIGSLFFMFPSTMTNTKEKENKNMDVSPSTVKLSTNLQMMSLGNLVKNFGKTTLALSKNSPFMLISMASAAEGLGNTGFAVFLPKLISNQFHKSQSSSALITGAVAIPVICASNVIGGVIVKRMKWGVQGMLRFSAGSIAFTLVFGLGLLLRCGQAKLAGVTVGYTPNNNTGQTNGPLSMTSGCNVDCMCHLMQYSPVCAENTEYFSPCHAGCKVQNNLTDCSCLSPGVTATLSKCDTSCDLLYVFIPLMFMIFFFSFISASPRSVALMRCVSEEHKTYALGIQSLCFRLLGAVPGPILIGTIFDSTCRVWQESCTNDKACWVYDDEKLSYYLVMIFLITKVINVALLFASSWTYKENSSEIHIPSVNQIGLAKHDIADDTTHSFCDNDEMNNGSPVEIAHTRPSQDLPMHHPICNSPLSETPTVNDEKEKTCEKDDTISIPDHSARITDDKVGVYKVTIEPVDNQIIHSNSKEQIVTESKIQP